MTTSQAEGSSPEDQSGDEGSAVVEFVFLGVLLMIPLVYLLLAVFAVQASAYALTAATREAGRAYATAADDGDGRDRAMRAAGIALADHGIDLAGVSTAITCDRAPCLSPGGRITVRLHRDVPLPLFGGAGPASVGVGAEHVAVVDRFRSLG